MEDSDKYMFYVKKSICKIMIEIKYPMITMVLLLALAPISTYAQWVQLGADINGEYQLDSFGKSVSLSIDGSIIAIGAPGNDDNNDFSNSGHTRVLKYDGANWVQLGGDIDGDDLDRSGNSVSLNDDGDVVAIGASSSNDNGNSSGQVRVYEFNGEIWEQRGGDIDGEAAADSFGLSVSLSADGTIVAAGGDRNDANGDIAGHVRVFSWNEGNWVQLGDDIDGEAAVDRSGAAISLSDDGLTVAIGAIGNDGNGSFSGHVRIYRFNGENWIQLGADLDGEAEGDFAGDAVALSSDGSIVAIGATSNNGDDNSTEGHARIYKYDGTSWSQLGTDLDGTDQYGTSVSLSSNGLTVAIGTGNGAKAGYTRIFEFNGEDWIQQGSDILGEADDDNSGSAVSLSSDGSTIAIGALGNDGSAFDAGHVRVYSFNEILSAGQSLSNEKIRVFPNPTARGISVELDGGDVNVKVVIRDVFGRVTHQSDYKRVSNLSVNLEGPLGIYFIEISSQLTHKVFRVVKQQ